jgi:hypothetical protein
MSKPDRHFRLVLWRLLYGVAVEKVLVRDDEIEACRHARLDLVRWDEQKSRFPQEWAKLLAKRQRRRDWFEQYGAVPDGWTPPDPADPRRSANKPIAAYLARRGMTIDEFMARYSRVPCGRGGKQPPWRMLQRVASWQ